MNGYVAKRRGRFYAVIYEGLDPVTGRERRRWHPAGTDRNAARRLAARLAAEEQGRADAVRALTLGAYLTGQSLPAKKLQLAASTYRSYERNVQRHILPALGRIGLRRLRAHHIGALYHQLLTPSFERPALAPKTVYELHLVIRGCRAEAARRGLLTRNVALLARSPKLKAIPKTERPSWTDAQLRQFLRTAAGHRLFPLLWLAAMTGLRRNEVLGLKWDDIDFHKRRLGLSRGLVAIGYERRTRLALVAGDVSRVEMLPTSMAELVQPPLPHATRPVQATAPTNRTRSRRPNAGTEHRPRTPSR